MPFRCFSHQLIHAVPVNIHWPAISAHKGHLALQVNIWMRRQSASVAAFSGGSEFTNKLAPVKVRHRT